MSSGFFDGIDKAQFEGQESRNPLAFRHYNPDEIVLGKSMAAQLRFAVAWWHSFAWEGSAWRFRKSEIDCWISEQERKEGNDG